VSLVSCALISAHASMTLLGLIWVAALPGQLAFHSDLSLLPSARAIGHPHAAWLAKGATAAVDTAGDSHALWREDSPSELKPQIHSPQLAEIDWGLWIATAAVTVVSSEGRAATDDLATPTEADLTSAGASQDLCAAHIRDLPVLTTPVDPASVSGAGYTIQVNDVVIGEVGSQAAADQVAQQIRQAMPALEANPAGLTPQISGDGDIAAAQLEGQTVFVLPEDIYGPYADHPALTVAHWVNNLRDALDAPPLDPSPIHMVAEGLGETSQKLEGIASWYGPYFHGRQTATGEIFDQHDLTAAHKTLPFDTTLKVRNLLNDKTVVVRINDRGPYIGDRSLDLSYAAAQCLGAEEIGLIPYEATILAEGIPRAWQGDAVAIR